MYKVTYQIFDKIEITVYGTSLDIVESRLKETTEELKMPKGNWKIKSVERS